MDQIPANKVKDRTKCMTNIFRSYFPYENRIGKRYSILVTEISSNNSYFVGHNEFYEQILIPKRQELMGKLIDVEIISVDKWCMFGKVINETHLNMNGSLVTKLRSLLESNDLQTSTVKLTSIGTMSILLIGMTIYFRFKWR